jgi:ring-1,2-phenylacetyl-CoA epoxidase subunit PaaD
VIPSITTEAIWQALEAVKDPEIPVVSVVEMGIVRNVKVEVSHATIIITPTFSGCPALHVIEESVATCVRALGFEQVTVRIELFPIWSTDWMTDATRAKLRAFGLAPPPHHGGDLTLLTLDEAECPYCGSKDTVLRNSFGPTLCRMIYTCNHCQQPFEQFKPL